MWAACSATGAFGSRSLGLANNRNRPRCSHQGSRARERGHIEAPWSLTTRVKGDSSAAVLEQIELQHGPDDRSIRLRGAARLTFGGQPRLDGTLSAPQLDLDRIVSLPEETGRRPLVAIKALADYLSGSQQLPIPIKLGVSVDALTFAGATLQRASTPDGPVSCTPRLAKPASPAADAVCLPTANSGNFCKPGSIGFACSARSALVLVTMIPP